MKEKLIQKPAISPDGRKQEIKSDTQEMSDERLFSGLNLAGLAEQLEKTKLLCEASPLNKLGVSPDNRCLQVDSKSENQTVDDLFYGSNLLTPDVLEQLKILFSSSEPSHPKKPAKDNFIPVKPPCPVTFSKIHTADVITSLIKVKTNKRVKASTLATYQKRLLLFQQRFAFLPENGEAIMDYLARFDGKSGRHRRNHQNLLNILCEHAIRRFGLTKNPMDELERPLVTHKPVKTLSLEQVMALNQTPQDLRERTALDILLGHGWRQIEVRRVQAKDVAAIDHQLILCHGKERQELAPLLPETADRLREMAQGLEPDDFLFVARQKRYGRRSPLGRDGMSQLIGRLLARAGIKGFTGHDLRRSFATLVNGSQPR